MDMPRYTRCSDSCAPARAGTITVGCSICIVSCIIAYCIVYVPSHEYLLRSSLTLPSPIEEPQIPHAGNNTGAAGNTSENTESPIGSTVTPTPTSASKYVEGKAKASQAQAMELQLSHEECLANKSKKARSANQHPASDEVLRNLTKSSHRCLGPSSAKTCMFHNVCVDLKSQGSSHKLLYFTDGAPGPSWTLNLVANYRGNMIGLQIDQFQKTFPMDAAMVADETTLVYQSAAEWNFGHMLGDSAWAIWNMQRVLDVPFDARITTWSIPVPYASKSYQGLVSTILAATSTLDQQAGNQILDSEAWRQHLFQTARNNRTNSRGMLCFPRLIAGTGLFTHSNLRDASSDWWQFRNFMIANLCASSSSAKPHIGISRKSLGGRWGSVEVHKVSPQERLQIEKHYSNYLTNIALLEQQLVKGLPNHSIDVADFKNMTMASQMSFVATLLAFVTPPGGGSFIGLFLPPGASLIIPIYPELGDDKEQSFSSAAAAMGGRFGAELMFWRHLKWLTLCLPPDAHVETLEALVHKAVDPDGSLSNLTGAQQAMSCLDSKKLLGF